MDTNNNRTVENFIDDDTRALLDQDCAEFFFDQAEKRLTDTIHTSMRITERAYVFSGMMLTAFIALFSGILSAPPFEIHSWWMAIFCIQGCLFSAIVLIVLLIKVMMPYSYRTIGSLPSSSNIGGFLKHYNAEQKPALVNIIANELCIIDLRIKHNTNSNEYRARHMKTAFKIVLYAIYTSLLTLGANIVVICLKS